MQLVNAREAKHAPGRPKTDKLDSVWLAKLTEKALLRPSFVPPAEIRVLRDYTRMRTDLTRERSRYWSRLEKLLEDSLIKVSAVVSSLDTASARDMVEALIAGERDPRVLAELARGRMRHKNAALVEALTGRFQEHHAELARLLLDQIDALNVQIDKLTARIGQLIAQIAPPGASSGHPGGGGSDHRAGTAAGQAAGCDCADPTCAHRQVVQIVRPVWERLDEIPGIGALAGQVIIAEVGLDMSRFPAADPCAYINDGPCAGDTDAGPCAHINDGVCQGPSIDLPIDIDGPGSYDDCLPVLLGRCSSILCGII